MIKDLFTLENISSTSGKLSAPWEFTFDYASISEKARKDKKERQVWIKNPALKHCFYSTLIGQSELARVTKDNPPKKLVAFAADFDCVLSDERLKESIAEMEIKPTFIETSIGNHRRLVWTLELPIYLATREFATFVLERAKKWLKLGLLPALDEGAWLDTSRLLCCGDKWEATGHGPIPVKLSQSFFVDCGRAYDFKGDDGVVISLDIVEKALKEKYGAKFNWPGDFVIASNGPSFWVEGSLSTNSAIVKPEGLFTFADHAEKPFWTWGDLLGKEFVEEFRTTSIAKATADIWYDGLKYHRKGVDGNYRSMTKDDFTIFLQNFCQLSTKPDNTGKSLINQCIWHVQQNQLISFAGPHAPLPKGIIDFQKKRCLNTYDCSAVEPATSVQYWGPSGNFPLYSIFLDTFFWPRLQKDFYLAWYKYFYEGVLDRVCRPGTMTILMGQGGCGKSLLNRHIVGTSVGGFIDASGLLLNPTGFNSQYWHVPFLALDDDTLNEGQMSSGVVHRNLKAFIANDVFLYNKKFEVPGSIQYGGRWGATANLDAGSARIVGPSDESIRMRISLFRCANMWMDLEKTIPDPEKGGFRFPARAELEKLLRIELPYFLRWLKDWKVPDHVPVDKERWGYLAYHEPSLIDLADQTSPAAPFKEIVFSTLGEFFRTNPTENGWRGNSHDLLQLLSADPRNFAAVKSLKPEQVNSRMELLTKEKALGCSWATDPRTRIRIWTFQRPAAQP